MRWVGNERGEDGDPCWSTIDPNNIQVENTSILKTGQVDGAVFVPAETNTSFRLG